MLRRAARKTWRYFETFVTGADAWLPPDNFQEGDSDAPPQLARRTSPTNVGIGLLSTLAAHDLGYISGATLVDRVDRTLTTLEGLERYEGHFLNWYNTATLAPLHPALRLHRGQRQPRGRADRAVARACRTRSRTRRPRRNGWPGLPTRAGVLAEVSWPKNVNAAARSRPAANQPARPRHRFGGRAAPRPRALGLAGRAGGPSRGSRPGAPAGRAGAGGPGDRLLVTRGPGRAGAAARPGGRPFGRARGPRGARRRDGRRHALRLPVRPAAPHLRDRVPPGGRRGARTARHVVLRPAGIRGPPGELRRHREGRRAAAPLVPSRPSRDERGRARHARVVGRHDVRVPDAAAADARLPGHPARSELSRQREAARSTTGGSAASRGASRNRRTRSPTAPAPTSTRHSACPGSG